MLLISYLLLSSTSKFLQFERPLTKTQGAPNNAGIYLQKNMKTIQFTKSFF